MISLRVSFCAFLLTLLSGCATFVAPMSSEPTDTNHGERTFGSVIEDQAIETKTKINIKRAGAPLSLQRIVVVSFNGQVLLAGQVESDALKKQAGDIAGKIRRVADVHNELQISGKVSGLARFNDAWLTRVAYQSGYRKRYCLFARTNDPQRGRRGGHSSAENLRRAEDHQDYRIYRLIT